MGRLYLENGEWYSHVDVASPDDSKNAAQVWSLGLLFLTVVWSVYA